jgi:hypothetical protein
VIGFTQAYFKSCIRFPFKDLLDERIVAVATSNTERRVRIIFSAELNARRKILLLERARLISPMAYSHTHARNFDIGWKEKVDAQAPNWTVL